MTFLAPWFLLGLVAAAVPLVVHLRRSRQARTINFSTTQFFDREFFRSARRAKIQDLLLMLLRMLLLGAFALALAQPLIQAPGIGAMLGLGGGPRKVALVIDDSASMRARTGKGSALDRAKAAAINVVDHLSAGGGDRATVILAGTRAGQAKTLFAKPTDDLDAVRSAIQSVKPTDLGTDLPGAMRQADAVLSGGPVSADQAGSPDSLSAADSTGRKEIYVFSDLQRTAVSQVKDLSPNPHTGVWVVDTNGSKNPANRRMSNLSIDAVQYGASRPMKGVPFTFRGLVTNHSPRSAQVGVALRVNGRAVDTKRITVPGGRSKVVRLAYRFTDRGWQRGELALVPPPPTAAGKAKPADQTKTSGEAANKPISEVAVPDHGLAMDSLAADNQRHFALRVSASMPVLAVDGSPSAIARDDELFFIRLALANARSAANPANQGSEKGGGGGRAAVDLKTVRPDAFDADDLAGRRLVILANLATLSEAQVKALQTYVDQGGALWVTLGDRVKPASYNRWLGPDRLHGGLLPGRLDQTRKVSKSTRTTANVENEGQTEASGTGDSDGVVAGQAPGISAPVNGVDDQPSATGWGVGWIDRRHPVLAGFTEGDLGTFNSVRLSRFFAVKPIDSEVLMTTADDQPLLLEKRFGRGRVILWSSTLDRDWTNFPLQPTYVPWLYRLVGYLAAPAIEGGGFITTGQVVSLPSSVSDLGSPVLHLPDGSKAYPDRSHAEASDPGQGFAQTDQAGVYWVAQRQAQAGESPTGADSQSPASDDSDAHSAEGGTAKSASLMFAANIPSVESSLSPLSPSKINALADAGTPIVYVDNPEKVGSVRIAAAKGYGLWDGLLILALAAAIFEPWLANALLSRRQSRGNRDAPNQTLARRRNQPGEVSTNASPPPRVAA